jgi:hypothetical protein
VHKAKGRRIRNAVTYARALAMSEDKELTLRHIVRVNEDTSKFTESAIATDERILQLIIV